VTFVFRKRLGCRANPKLAGIIKAHASLPLAFLDCVSSMRRSTFIDRFASRLRAVSHRFQSASSQNEADVSKL